MSYDLKVVEYYFEKILPMVIEQSKSNKHQLSKQTSRKYAHISFKKNLPGYYWIV